MVLERRAALSLIRPKILVTRRLPAAVEERMATLFEATLNRADTPMTADQLVEALAGCEVLVSSITDRIDARLVSRIPESVKLIAQFGFHEVRCAPVHSHSANPPSRGAKPSQSVRLRSMSLVSPAGFEPATY